MQDKQEISYEVITVMGEMIAVGLEEREGRFPVAQAKVLADGRVELTCHDGRVEVMGSPGAPCPLGVIERLRTHHEGLLIVEFPSLGKTSGSPDNLPLREQLVRDGFRQ